MPATITLSNLGWTSPDGTAVLTDISQSYGAGRHGIVGRNGAGKSLLLRLIAGEIAPTAGHIRQSGRAAMLRQIPQQRPGDLLADLFGARTALDAIARAAAGTSDADSLAVIDWTLPDRIASALDRLGLDLPPETALAALSGGQITRAALAALIHDDPEILLLDEPTNTLDADGRRAVRDLLAGWRGPALVVSHDRNLLAQMDTITELGPLGARRYGGHYADWQAQKALELAAASHDLTLAERARTQLARRGQAAAERQARSDSAGKRHAAKGGQPKIQLDAWKARAEATGAAGARLQTARMAQADQDLTEARARVAVLTPLRMTMAPCGLPPGRRVLQMTGVTGGHDPAAPAIRDLSLRLTGPERMAVTGPNGAGKSTLLALATGALVPLAGQISITPRHVLLDQRLSLLRLDATLRDNFHRLVPATPENDLRAALARFGFRAGDALHPVGQLSGGQRLRAALACTLGRADPPELLILDEPTNHLDLDATAELEAALQGYDGAILLVSHDAGFLAALAPLRRIDLPTGLELGPDPGNKAARAEQPDAP